MHDPHTRISLSLDGRASDRPRVARRWVIDRCAELHLDMEGTDLPLLVSELVTNACVHGAEPISFTWTWPTDGCAWRWRTALR